MTIDTKADFVVFSDGGSRGNPGEAAYGFLIMDKDGKTFYQEGSRLGIATNNVAEYMGIVKALEYLSKNIPTGFLNVACYMDSQLAAQQLNGNWKIKNEVLRNLYHTVKSLEQKIGNVTYTSIPREQNKDADKLVNEALDAPAS